ncbi:beta-galactosidase [Termitidicoccus mucosus]|uniref:Beta-galactosidase n=1 Tax=Termitidicoccus mucosus TaxID=1184151 RepID=A0A178IMW2_9BACT|nr:hypothetical protein AW736_00430 [Opitutaceae bacterium TSB47]
MPPPRLFPIAALAAFASSSLFFAFARAQDFSSGRSSSGSAPSSGSDSQAITDAYRAAEDRLASGAPGAGGASGANVTATTSATPPATTLQTGTPTNPEGDAIGVTSRGLTLNGTPWTPVMGEFHYARYPENEWRDELLKMKSGGIDIVATYVFWIHHEEIEGTFDWSGRRDLRRFVETCKELDLKVIVRCGPWCHGEVRNGGLPDWLLASGCRVRSDDPAYMEKARVLYTQIAAQLKALLWKDGGPVVGIQLENEYRGPAEHLLALKRMAIDAGIDVPLYTRTGWPALTSPMPPGEILPLFGVYAEGFWDREMTPMPGNYWAGFRFSTLRADSNIANEALGRGGVTDEPGTESHPYLTCEIGGGMMSSYHRRILNDPRDIESTTIVKLGSGGVSPGYYMYHGGENPDGRLSTLEENQSAPTTNWNDLPVKNYDFQAPLGAAGQFRPHFHLLRRLHLFVHDFGYLLPGMPVTLPERRPQGKDDTHTLRWSVRSDGHSGFIFVNNYQRLQPMPAREGVQFELNLARDPLNPNPKAGPTKIPVAPFDVPADSAFILPFNMALGYGVELAYATAQPLCMVESFDGKMRNFFFAEIPGIVPELAITDNTIDGVGSAGGRQRKADGLIRIVGLKPSQKPALSLRSRSGHGIRIIVLSHADSLNLYKLEWGDEDCVFLSPGPVTIAPDQTLAVHTESAEPVKLKIHPSFPQLFPKKKGFLRKAGQFVAWIFREPGREGAIFETLTLPSDQAVDGKPARLAARAKKIRDAGPAREIALGNAPKPVPAAPSDADFAQAAVWEIELPPASVLAAAGTAPLLRLHYAGDVARVRLGEKLVMDDFYNGQPLDLSLDRYRQELASGTKLTVSILPLRKDSPVYMADGARPRFGKKGAVAELSRVEIVQRHTHTLVVKDADDADDDSDDKDTGKTEDKKARRQ